MNIDLSKYLKNKDVKIKNEDFDFDAMSNDIYKGYVKEDSLKEKYVPKTDYEKIVGEKNDLTTKYTGLETNFNNQTQTLADTNAKLSKTSLEKTMISKGFKEESFDEIAKLRSSLFADEKDDAKAINSIADKYKATYFPETANKPAIPNEPGLNGGQGGSNGHNGGNDIKITRDTPLRSMTAPVK